MAIDSESRLTNDLKIVWWGSEHLLNSLAIAFPSIVIWGFGIPLFAWIILARHKEDIGNVEFRGKYGFLLNGYKKEYYYWESINMYRKIWIIFISIFLKIAGVITQALVVFLVLNLFLILNLKLMPYSFQSLNDMELISIITCMLTIYCGIFFLSDMPEVYNSDDPTLKQADNGRKHKINSL